MTNRGPRLVDIRQIGPNRERDISGVCSVCKDVLLVRLNSKEVPSRIELREALSNLFERHVTQSHEN